MAYRRPSSAELFTSVLEALFQNKAVKIKMFSYLTKLSTKSMFCKYKEKLHLFVNSSACSYTVLLQNKRDFNLRKEMKMFFISSEGEYPL